MPPTGSVMRCDMSHLTDISPGRPNCEAGLLRGPPGLAGWRSFVSKSYEVDPDREHLTSRPKRR